jgi:hypothetical protein
MSGGQGLCLLGEIIKSRQLVDHPHRDLDAEMLLDLHHQLDLRQRVPAGRDAETVRVHITSIGPSSKVFSYSPSHE